MQKLVQAAKEGTRDGLEKTKAAVKRGRSFIRTKSFVSPGLRPPGPTQGPAGGQWLHSRPWEPAHRWARAPGLGRGAPCPATLWNRQLIGLRLNFVISGACAFSDSQWDGSGDAGRPEGP